MTSPRSQGGVMLIEALIGILIFSIGILALIGMQGVAIKNTTDARFRTEAAFLANGLVGQMWVDLANLDKYDTSGGSYGPRDNWVSAVERALPGVDVAANVLPPQVVYNAANNQVTISIQWKQPGETQSCKLDMIARIKGATSP